MQAKTQISGQSSGQTTCQITGVSNANSLPMSGGSHRTWQSDSDVAIRRNIVEKILHLFQKRKPRVSQEWQQKLPEFVKRLEESLYRDASSKEEYSDLSTLENRLFAVAKRIMPARNMASNVANAPASSMIPTPGATMIPIPGNEAVAVSNTGLGTVKLNPNNVSPNVSSMLQRQGMGTAGTMTSMVPTPGLGCNTLTSTEPSTSSTGNSPAAPVQGGAQTQRQSYGPGASGHLLSNMNSQLGPNIQRKNPMSFGYVNGGTSNNVQLMGSGQHLMNGNIAFPNPSMYMNSVQYGNVQLQRQQHATQQRQQHMPMQFTNVPSNSAAMHPPVMQASTMIPVPGMPPQHMNPQSHLQQSLSQPEKKTHSISPSKLAGPARDQQQQDQVAAKVSYQAQSPSNTPARKLMSEESQVGMGLLPASNASIQTIGIGQQHQQLSNNHYKHVNNPTKEYPSQISSDQDHAMMKPVHEQQTQKQPDMHLIHPLQEDKLPYIQQQTSNSHAQAPQNLQRHQPVVQHSSQMLQQRPQQQILHPGYGESSQRSLQISDNGGALPGHPGSVQVPTVGRSMNMDGQRAQQYLKQQRWLLFLRHASKCTAPEGQCQTTPHCLIARELWSHITKCTDRDCQYPRCQPSRTLIRHHQNCRDPQCPVCAPVRQKLGMQRMQPAQANSSLSVGPNTVVRTSAVCAEGNTEASLNKVSSLPVGPADDHTPPAKRPKLEQIETVKAAADAAVTDPKDHQVEPHLISVKVEENVSESVKVEGARNIFVPPAGNRIKSEEDNKMKLKGEDQKKYEETNITEVERTVKHEKSGAATAESSLAASIKLTTPAKQEVKQEIVSSPASDPGTIAKCTKPKIKGVSLTELFTPEQIREHIYSLRQWVGQSKAKVEKNQAMESRMTENSCQLCAVETLTFEPPPIYCTLCGARVKRNAFYWTMQIGDTRHYFCVPCYNDSRTENVEIDGATFPKSRLEKRRNDEETEEPWVQCDKCEKWQHQVCALFNMRRNEGGQAEYTCPHCLMIEVEKGERKPLPQSAVLGAKDLPRTLLSDHIEQRLSRKLKQERMDRARSEGKNYEEVPGAESLVIRIVSSVDKKLDVKQRFLEMFQEEDYPTEFPYKSKVLLLFQRIEGVEVCLFGMYVQEFGSDAAQPNQRRVYLSYLDSVKYFRPDVKTNNGEALRTFVYHEILIGYLDYCKKRGFTSCYIWACPPLKGEDYILYCHPEIQKTPKSDKLREWYLTMLRKAASEGIVAELTNMYDHFFIRSGESKAKVTAARLPYFEGDYWPGAAEDMIMQLQEEEGGLRQQKKGKTKKTITKRATKTAVQAELANNASKDLQLMHKLGETIFPMKEDFIMVHLQFACSHCCNFIISGQRWTCKQCKNFSLCDRCHDAEHALDDRDRHPLISKEAHLLFPVELGEPLGDTKDKDEITESEFFDTRQAFLSLCQGNHYQYDTLRRAKHSSMMVLYHLHNPTAPAFVTTCNMCSRDIETGQGWRCETCPDFDVCNSCYSKSDSVKHPHKLSPHPSATERTAQNKEARQQRVVQLRKMLDLLVHASQCGSPVCQYPTCRKVKGLFRHGMSCKVRASGGCHLCKKMWYLLQLHARACKESECRVPRCKDLKEHLRRLQQQMESRRRAAVNEMMRQRAAEAAAGSS